MIVLHGKLVRVGSGLHVAKVPNNVALNSWPTAPLVEPAGPAATQSRYWHTTFFFTFQESRLLL